MLTRKTTEEPAAGIAAKGTKGALAVAGRRKRGEKIGQQPGGRMHKGGKRLCLFPQGLKSQDSG